MWTLGEHKALGRPWEPRLERLSAGILGFLAGGAAGGGTGFVIGIPTGPGEAVAIPAGAAIGATAGTAAGVGIGGAIGGAVGNAAGVVGHAVGSAAAAAAHAIGTGATAAMSGIEHFFSNGGAPKAGGQCPKAAEDTLGHIDQKGTAPAGFKGGGKFENDGRGGGQVLPSVDPQGNPINYREWDVNSYVPGVNRGLQRLVTGSDGSAYYTNDHYNTFTRIR